MKKWSLFFRKWHRWIALIIGAQLFLWTFSGLYMSLVPIEKIRSEHLVKKLEPNLLSYSADDKALKSLQDLLQDRRSKVTEVRLKKLLDKTVYEFHYAKEKIETVDAITGQPISPIGEALAKEIAVNSFAGLSEVKEAKLISEKVIEYRGKYPVWRIDFDNWEQTSFYVSPENGSLTAKRSLLWRVYDFLWMLHIMDYSERKNFNNWWLILAALLGFSMSATGLVLLRYSFKWKKLNFMKRK